MFLVVEENDNCAPEERVFSTSGENRRVKEVQVETPNGTMEWCHVIGVNEEGRFINATAIQVEDSGAGSAWLIYGGNWGIRFRLASDSPADWSLKNEAQWGAPFKVLDISGNEIRFH